jgi:hypothetical protein
VTTTWAVRLSGTLSSDILWAHRRALATLPAMFRESTTTSEDGRYLQPLVAVVSVAVPDWEERLGALRGALVTDLAQLDSSGIDRLYEVVEASGVRIVPDLPETHDRSAVRLKATVGLEGGVRLAIGAGRSPQNGGPRLTTLRSLALTQIMVLSPLIAGKSMRIGPVCLGDNAFTCSFEVEGVVLELSGVVSGACPASTEVTVLGEGLLAHLVVPAEMAEWPSELSETTEGKRYVAPMAYSSGRREAWLRLHGALEETEMDLTPTFLADLCASVTALEQLGLTARTFAQ